MRSILAALAVTVAGSTAIAQPARTAADVEFERGRALLDAGKFAEACAAFDASQKLDPELATELNQADCREKNGQLATAWALFSSVAAKTQTASDDRAKKFHKVAVEHAQKLDARLSRLTVRAGSPVAGLDVRRGTDVVELDKTRPIDGGTYTITAQAPGHRAWSRTITIARERDQSVLDIPQLEAIAIAKSIAKPIAKSASKTLPLALAGGTVVLLGASLGFELSARGVYRDAEVEPDDAKQTALWNSANTRRHVAQGFAAGGLAVAGVAAWMWLRGGRETAVKASAGLAIEPMGVAGIQLRGAW